MSSGDNNNTKQPNNLPAVSSSSLRVLGNQVQVLDNVFIETYPEYWYLKARESVNKSDWDRGIYECNKSLFLDKHYHPALILRAYIYSELDNVQKCVEDVVVYFTHYYFDICFPHPDKLNRFDMDKLWDKIFAITNLSDQTQNHKVAFAHCISSLFTNSDNYSFRHWNGTTKEARDYTLKICKALFEGKIPKEYRNWLLLIQALKSLDYQNKLLAMQESFCEDNTAVPQLMDFLETTLFGKLNFFPALVSKASKIFESLCYSGDLSEGSDIIKRIIKLKPECDFQLKHFLMNDLDQSETYDPFTYCKWIPEVYQAMSDYYLTSKPAPFQSLFEGRTNYEIFSQNFTWHFILSANQRFGEAYLEYINRNDFGSAQSIVESAINVINKYPRYFEAHPEILKSWQNDQNDLIIKNGT